MGELYELGKGIEKDVLMSFQFYKKSAEKGYVNGKYKLGYCYNHGIGTDVDKEKTFDLYKIAAEEEIMMHKKVLQFCMNREKEPKKI